MKPLYKSLKCAVILAALLINCLYSGCKNPEPKSQSEMVAEKLASKTWSVKTVTIDNIEMTSNFSGLTIAFTPSTFTTTNGKVVWPASGSWSFTDDSASALKRDDQVVVTIEEISTTTLKLSLTWSKTTFGSGRKESVNGAHVFTFQ